VGLPWVTGWEPSASTSVAIIYAISGYLPKLFGVRADVVCVRSHLSVGSGWFSAGGGFGGANLRLYGTVRVGCLLLSWCAVRSPIKRWYPGVPCTSIESTS